MRKNRNPWLLLILLFFGALVGGILGEFLSVYPFFTWMSFGGSNGYKELFALSMNPAFDFRVIRFGFDFALKVNAGSILGIILAVFIFFKI